MTLPGFTECPECFGRRFVPAPCPDEALYRRRGMACTVAHSRPCPSCSGVGVVPDPETVEAVAKPTWRAYFGDEPTLYHEVEAAEKIARAALLAYARKAKEQT